jgi:hypothetical protein
MSLIGQNRKSGYVEGTSALLPKADIRDGDPLSARNGHRCRKISNLHGVSEIALLSREIAFFRPIARRRLP